MFRQLFILGLVSGGASSFACYIYASQYWQLVDFSEATSVPFLVGMCFAVAMLACFGNFGLRKLIKKPALADFVFNAVFSMLSITMVFVILIAEDPQFENPDVALMAEYFKGYLMPIVFFPSLTWFTFKPLIVRQ